MAIVTLAVPALEVGDSSGFLVPAVDGRRIKAATYSFSKWGWVGATSDLRILRASIGRHREEASLQATDDELVARVVADLALATGQEIRPVEAHVQRWGGALPQYAVGHLADQLAFGLDPPADLHQVASDLPIRLGGSSIVRARPAGLSTRGTRSLEQEDVGLRFDLRVAADDQAQFGKTARGVVRPAGIRAPL